jgi:polysaccharide biosynthesis transport protein
MSRNFELLQRIGQDKVFTSEEDLGSVSTATTQVVVNATPALELDESTREEVGRLVHRLFLSPANQGPKHVTFTATESGNGCTSICAQAAEILASQVGASVCLIDCNFDCAAVHKQFSCENQYGLGDALIEDGPVSQYIQPTSRPNLWLLTCGTAHSKSSELLVSDRMRARLAEIRARYDYVLMDVAALHSSNHAMFLGSLSDGVVLVLKANASRRDSAREATRQLQASNIRLLGAVLNQRTFPIPERIYKKL